MTTKRMKRSPHRMRDEAPTPEAPSSDQNLAVPTESAVSADPAQAGGDEVALTPRTSTVRDPGADEAATTAETTRERSREPGPDDVVVSSERTN